MITLKVDVLIDDTMLAKAGRQVPFAMANAMNSAMKKAQARQRSRMRAVFTIRRAKFLDLSVKITEFAKKNSLATELAIAPPGDAANIFGKFEPGGVKRPRDGKHLAIPATGTPIKRSRTTVIRKENRPRALLDAAETAPRDRGAFIRPAKGGRPAAIFLRRGKHLVLAYNLEDDAKLDPTLKFEDTVSREFTKVFPAEFDREFAKAIASAR
jgi:hypothetical protein